MNRKKWKIPYARPEYPEELRQAGYGPLLSAVLALRGVRSAGEAQAMLHGGPETLHDPLLMADMGKARDRLLEAIRTGETVAVFGDYDVDGITATCLLTEYLRSKGLRCHPYIPDRSGEGYGLNKGALKSLREKGVSLVVTVDCGITAVEEALYARELGLDLVITDHHECGKALPEAVAVVDCCRGRPLSQQGPGRRGCRPEAGLRLRGRSAGRPGQIRGPGRHRHGGGRDAPGG